MKALIILTALLAGCATTEKCGTNADGDEYCVIWSKA